MGEDPMSEAVKGDQTPASRSETPAEAGVVVPGEPAHPHPVAHRHRLEYRLIRAVTATVGRLPSGAGDAAVAWLARLAYRPLGIRREVVEANLRAAFPGMDGRWIRSTAAAAYEHLGREAMSLLRLSRMEPAAVRLATDVEGLEAFRAALERGRGIVLVTGHLGNWEIGGAALATRGIPMDVVAQQQRNPLFDRMIVSARERLGMCVIDRTRASRLALRSLRAGRVVAFVADQDARDSGVFVRFFGRAASTHRGPAVLAARAGSPIFLGTAIRCGRGRYRIRLEEVPAPRTASAAEDDLTEWTARFTALLEEAIKQAPGQYFWHHRRWKTLPPEEQVRPTPV